VNGAMAASGAPGGPDISALLASLTQGG